MFCVTGEERCHGGDVGYVCFVYGLLLFQVNHYPIHPLNTLSTTVSRKGER